MVKAVLFHGPEDIRLEQVPIPELQEGEVLVEIKTALTGGTDVKTYQRGHPKIIKTLPSSFGYEFAGTVSSSKVEAFKPGDRVLAANTAPCFECFFCKKEEYELCENLDFLNGSFAEYIKIPAQISKHNLYKIPQSVSYTEAACAQTLAVALHGFRKSQIKENDIVVVYGLGAIGQCFIKLCKSLLKHCSIIAIGKSQLKKTLAIENGANHVLDYSQVDIVDAVKDLSNGYGADIVIEAVGKPETWTQALKLVRAGGLVNFFGGCPKGTKIELDTFQAHYQELRTVGVFHHSPAYIQEALDLISSGTISVDNLITNTMPLEELETALTMSMRGEALKICILP